MSDLKTVFSNFMFQFENTIDVLRKTLLHVLATFLVWFASAMALGIAFTLSLKIFESCFS